jgi:predicted amidohydrolase
MSRTIRIAAIQLPAWTEGETPAARYRSRCQTVLHWLAEAGTEGADMVCLGETCTGEETIEQLDSARFIHKVTALAAQYQMNIILPVAGLVDGLRRNVALVIDRTGAIAGRYYKVHPTRREIQDGVEPGDHFPVFQLDFGCVGVAICHDLSFPESARVLALRGAEIIVWPTWWSGWGEELCYAVIRSRAIDNSVWLVTASFGIPDEQAWRPGMVLGRSGVIGPDGVILSSAGRYVGMSLCAIDLDKPRLAHAFAWNEDGDFWTSVLADRRPDAYTPITDPALVIPAVPPEQRLLRAVRGQIPSKQAMPVRPVAGITETSVPEPKEIAPHERTTQSEANPLA